MSVPLWSDTTFRNTWADKGTNDTPVVKGNAIKAEFLLYLSMRKNSPIFTASLVSLRRCIESTPQAKIFTRRRTLGTSEMTLRW